MLSFTGFWKPPIKTVNDSKVRVVKDQLHCDFVTVGPSVNHIGVLAELFLIKDFLMNSLLLYKEHLTYFSYPLALWEDQVLLLVRFHHFDILTKDKALLDPGNFLPQKPL